MPKVIIPQDNGDLISQTLKQNPGAAVYGDSGNMGINKGIANFYSTPSSFNSNIVQGKQVPIYGNSPDYYKDMYSEDQGTVNKLFHGVGRAATVLGFEVAKMVPGIIGLGAAAGGNIIDGIFLDGDQFDGMSWINNKAVQWLDEKEQAAKENPYLAIYSNSAYDKMNWTEKLGTTDFWVTQGADGIGFMASMFAPGAVLKALGVAGKIGIAAAEFGSAAEAVQLARESEALIAKGIQAGELLSTANKTEKAAFAASKLNQGIEGEKLFEAAGKISKAMDDLAGATLKQKAFANAARYTKPFWNITEEGTSKLGRGVDIIGTSGANAVFESASESDETMNTYKEQLRRENPSMSEEDLQKHASEAAAVTFQYNLPLLLASNMLLETVILGKFDNALGIGKRSAKEATEDAASLLKKYNVEKPAGISFEKYLSENLKPVTGKRMLFETVLYKAPLGMLKEGLGEEGLQNSVQRYAKIAADKGKGTGIFEDLGGIFDEYGKSISDLGDNEFWESVALGAALGGFGEAGIVQHGKMMLNGGTANLEYNRRINGGAATEKPNMLGRIVGKKQQFEEKGIISNIQQVMSDGFGKFDTNTLYELNEDGTKKIVDGKPVIKPNAVNHALRNTIFSQLQIDDLNNSIKVLETQRKSGNTEIDKLINSQVDTEIENAKSEIDALNDMVMYDSFKHLFDLGVFSKDMSNTVVQNLIDRQKALIMQDNPMIKEHEIDEKLDEYKKKLQVDMSRYENVYKEFKEYDKYDMFFTPDTKDTDLYREWKHKQYSNIVSHLFYKNHKDNVVSSIDKRLNALNTTKQGFQELEDTLVELYNSVNDDNADAETKRLLGSYKKDLDQIKDIKDKATAETEKELDTEAREQFKKFGNTGLKDESGNQMSEDDFVSDYIKDAKNKRATTDKWTKNEQGKNSKSTSTGMTEFEKRVRNKSFMLRYNLITLLKNKPELFAKIPSLSKLKDTLERMLGTEDYSSGMHLDTINYKIEQEIENLTNSKKEVVKDIRTSTLNFGQAISSYDTEQRFNKYKENKKRLDDERNAPNVLLDSLISVLDNSNYISGKEIKRFKTLESKTNRTTEENQEYGDLLSKGITDETKPDYDLIFDTEETKNKVRKLYVYKGKSILLSVKDNFHLNDYLTGKEIGRYKELIKIDKAVLTTMEETELANLSSKIQSIDIVLKTNEWPAKEDTKAGWYTGAMFVKDTGMSLQTDFVKKNFNGQYSAMSVNSKTFFDRFSGIQVNDRDSDKFQYMFKRSQYYTKLRNRLNRIGKIERLVSYIPEQIAQNEITFNSVKLILDTLSNVNMTGNAQELLSVLNGMITNLEQDFGILDYKDKVKALANLGNLSYKDKQPVLLNEVLANPDLTDIEKSLLNQIINKNEEEKTYDLEKLYLKDALGSYRKYLLGDKAKKSKVYYILKDMRKNLERVGVSELKSSKQIAREALDRRYEENIASVTGLLEKDKLDKQYEEDKKIIESSIPGESQWVTSITTESIQGVMMASAELLENNLKNLQTDIENIKKTQVHLNNIQEEWRGEDFEINKLHDEFSEKYRELAKDLGEIESIKVVGGLPQYVNQIRERIAELERIKAKLADLPGLSEDLQSALDHIKILFPTLNPEDLEERLNLTDEQIQQLDEGMTSVSNTRKEIRTKGIVIANKLKQVNKEVKSIEDKKILERLDESKELMFDYYVTNILYKALNKSFGNLKDSEKVKNAYADELAKPNEAILTGKVDNLWVLTTNDVLYEEQIINGKRSIGDRYEQVQVGDKLISVSKLSDVQHQQAFQDFIRNADMRQHELAHFGMKYMIANGIIIKDGKNYKLGVLTGKLAKHQDVFNQLLETINEYAKGKKEAEIQQLEEAIYAIPFNTVTGQFYQSNNSFAITAMMHPENRFGKYKPQLKALHGYINSNKILLEKLKPTLRDALKTKVGKGAEEYYDLYAFYALMQNAQIHQYVEALVKEYFLNDFRALSASEFKVLDIKQFSKGFKLRAYDNGQVYRRKFEPADEVQEIFVITKKSKVIGKRTKTISTSDTFYGDEYLGMVSAKYKDGTEELLQMRNLNTNEAETVATLLLMRAQNSMNNFNINGQSVFPQQEYGDKTKPWENGIISSLIRYGTIRDTTFNKGHNPANFSKKKQKLIENNQARPYDIWMTGSTNSKIHWIDADNVEHEINSSKIVELVNNEIVFNKQLMLFLQSKQFNIPADLSKKVFMPILNREALRKSQSEETNVPLITLKEITDTNKFYMYGDENTEAPTLTGSVPGYPRVVGRNIRFKPSNTNFEFKAKPVEIKSTTKKKEGFVDLDMKVEAAPDGEYQVQVANQLYNITIEDNKIVEENVRDTVLDNKIFKAIDSIKDDKLKASVNSLKQTVEQYKSEKDIDVKAKLFKNIQEVLRNMFVESLYKDSTQEDIKAYNELFKDIDLSYTRNGVSYTNKQVRDKIAENKELYKQIVPAKYNAAGDILNRSELENNVKIHTQIAELYSAATNYSDFKALETYIDSVVRSMIGTKGLSISDLIKTNEYILFGIKPKEKEKAPVIRNEEATEYTIENLDKVPDAEVLVLFNKSFNKIHDEFNNATDELGLRLIRETGLGEEDKVKGAILYWYINKKAPAAETFVPVVITEEQVESKFEKDLREIFTSELAKNKRISETKRKEEVNLKIKLINEILGNTFSSEMSEGRYKSFESALDMLSEDKFKGADKLAIRQARIRLALYKLKYGEESVEYEELQEQYCL